MVIASWSGAAIASFRWQTENKLLRSAPTLGATALLMVVPAARRKSETPCLRKNDGNWLNRLLRSFC